MSIVKNYKIKVVIFLLLGLGFVSFVYSQNKHKTINAYEDGTIQVRYDDGDTLIFRNGYCIENWAAVKSGIHDYVRDFVVYGYLPYRYCFSEMEYRQVELEFLNDSIFTVLCYTKDVEPSPSFYIKETYSYHFLRNNFYTVVVDSLLTGNREINDNRPICKPYNSELYSNPHKYNKFPYLSGDTIHISLDASKMFVGYFTLDRITRIKPKLEETPYVMPESLDTVIRNKLGEL